MRRKILKTKRERANNFELDSNKNKKSNYFDDFLGNRLTFGSRYNSLIEHKRWKKTQIICSQNLVIPNCQAKSSTIKVITKKKVIIATNALAYSWETLAQLKNVSKTFWTF